MLSIIEKKENLRVVANGKTLTVSDISKVFDDASVIARNLKPETTYHVYIEIRDGKLIITYRADLIKHIDFPCFRIVSLLTTKKPKWWQFWKPVQWIGFKQFGDVFRLEKQP